MFNVDEFAMYGFTTAILRTQFESYVQKKIYDFDFGDLAPYVIANLLTLELSVLDTDNTGTETKHCFNSNTLDARLLTIQRKGDHYNGSSLHLWIRWLESAQRQHPMPTITYPSPFPP